MRQNSYFNDDSTGWIFKSYFEKNKTDYSIVDYYQLTQHLHKYLFIIHNIISQKYLCI